MDDDMPPPVEETMTSAAASPPLAAEQLLPGGNENGGGLTQGEDGTVLFEGEQFEVVEIDDSAPPPEDDDDVDDDSVGDNNEEFIAMGVDGLTMEDDEANSLAAGADEVEDTSSATLSGHSDSVYSVAAHRMEDGSVRVLTGGGDDVATLWNLTISPNDAAVGGGEEEGVGGSGGGGGGNPLSHTVTPTAVATLSGHTDSVGAVAFSSDGSLCASGGLDGLVKVWDAGSGELKRTLEGPSDCEWLTWHSKGNVLLAGSSDGTVWMWLATSGACMQVFAGHEGAVTCGLFTPDGRAVVTGGADATVRVWAPKKGTCRHVFQGHGFHETAVTCLSAHPLFDPSGAASEAGAGTGSGGSAEHSLVLSGGEDGFGKLVHVGTKKVVASFAHSSADQADYHGCHGGGGGGGGGRGSVKEAFSVEAVGLSGLQPWAATGGIDGTCKVWDVNTGRLRHVLSHPRSGAVTRLKWHPREASLLTSSADGVVRVWDARTASSPVREFGGHGDMVVDLATCFVADRMSGGEAKSAALRPDLFVTSSDDTTAKVFTLPDMPLQAFAAL